MLKAAYGDLMVTQRDPRTVVAVELLCLPGLLPPAPRRRGELPLFHPPDLGLEAQLLDHLLLVGPRWVVHPLCPPGQVPLLIPSGHHLRFLLGLTVLLQVFPGKS